MNEILAALAFMLARQEIALQQRDATIAQLRADAAKRSRRRAPAESNGASAEVEEKV